MEESVYASSRLYHAAFRNTMTKATLFIDRQQNTKGSPGHTTHSGLSDDDEDENDDNNSSSDIQRRRALSPPPAYLTPSSLQPTLIPSHYLALLTTDPTKPFFYLQQQQQSILLKRRPLSPPPPHYIDGTTEDWQRRRSCIILPRDEEGQEDLPDYHCSVCKTGIMDIKIERGSHRRSWKRVSVELWGTVVRMYTMTWFGRPKDPTLLLSLAGAEAGRALDYRKRPYVFRLKTDNVHCLFQAMDLDDMNAWIEHLQAGINISLDLEERPMPKFLTLQPRRLPDTGILGPRMIEMERRRERRRLEQQEILA